MPNAPRTTQDAKPKFAVGDPVMRPDDVYAKHSKMRYGVVTDCYSRRSRFGWYPELYMVRWENGEEREYLPHGIFPTADARPPR